MSIVARLLSCQRGAAAIEFAIVSVVFLSLVVATIDFGRTLYVKNQLSFLADQAVRKVLINPGISNITLTDELRADFNAGVQADLGVTISDETIGGNAYRLVQITYPMTLFIPNLDSSALVLSVDRRVPSG